MASLTGSTSLRKTSDQTVNNSTTLVNDADFSFAVAANEVWIVEIHAGVQILAASDFKFTFALPAGASMRVTGISADGGTTFLGAMGTTPGDTTGLVITSAGNPTHLHVYALLIMSSTAGTAQFQWAQNTAVAEDTKVLANSFLLAAKEA